MTVTYSGYLKLDQLLSIQEPRPGVLEHDETLFVIIHQIYELWFKEVLHELDYLQKLLRANDTPLAAATLKRILTILKTLVAQIDVFSPISFARSSSYSAKKAGPRSSGIPKGVRTAKVWRRGLQSRRCGMRSCTTSVPTATKCRRCCSGAT